MRSVSAVKSSTCAAKSNASSRAPGTVCREIPFDFAASGARRKLRTCSAESPAKESGSSAEIW
eukprot:1092898-Rhodomonas_salina.3